MIIMNDKNQVTELNFSDLYVLEKWMKKFIYEIKEIESHLCRCKYNILRTKWHEIIYWYMLWGNKCIHNQTATIEDFIQSVTDVIKSYEKKIQQDTTMSSKIYVIFRELHKVTTNEFVDACKYKIVGYNDNLVTTTQLIDFVGSQLYKVLLNTIFELTEILINCEYSNHCTDNTPREDESVRFLINDLYNVNSYSIFKLNKFIELLDVDTKKIEFIADFKYFEETSINPNLVVMLDKATEQFKTLTITNLNKDIQNTLWDKFKNNIVK